VYGRAMTGPLTISQAARASGLSVDTIRFYERIGVLPSPPRSASGYRRYTDDHVRILRFAHRLRQLGLPLSSVRRLVSVLHDARCSDVREELLETVRASRRRIAEQLELLTRTARELELLERELASASTDDPQLPALRPCSCLQLIGGER